MIHVFDTSAIIASHHRSHPQFQWASTQLRESPALALCTHSLAECYAVLSASPQFSYPLPDVTRFLESLRRNWRLLPLSPDDYLRAAARCRDLGLPGGAIYDTLLTEAALQAGATAIVTLNPKHFRRLGQDVEHLVIAPG